MSLATMPVQDVYLLSGVTAAIFVMCLCVECCPRGRRTRDRRGRRKEEGEEVEGEVEVEVEEQRPHISRYGK